jgi:hypothetical protein
MNLRKEKKTLHLRFNSQTVGMALHSFFIFFHNTGYFTGDYKTDGIENATHNAFASAVARLCRQ